jgi:hypothetical protein
VLTIEDLRQHKLFYATIHSAVKLRRRSVFIYYCNDFHYNVLTKAYVALKKKLTTEIFYQAINFSFCIQDNTL